MGAFMRELELAKRLAVKAGDFLLGHLGGRRRIRFKGSGTTNVVTEMDRASEDMIVRRLRREFPDHAIVAEEGGAHGDSPCCWHIDPLDGTTNYAHGLPIWSVSIAYAVRGRVEAGAIYAPTFGTLFWAQRGHGAFRNGQPIRVSRTNRMGEALLATGFPYREPMRSMNLRYFAAFMTRTQALRRPGSASLDIAWVASGALDGYWEFSLGSWDIAAGILLAEEAGARVSDFRGRPVDLSVGQVLMANPRLHRQMLAVLGRVRL
jgi:myo-inositol-1(or 4)-monophosphatase